MLRALLLMLAAGLFPAHAETVTGTVTLLAEDHFDTGVHKMYASGWVGSQSNSVLGRYHDSS